jgi:hypothetical protein
MHADRALQKGFCFCPTAAASLHLNLDEANHSKIGLPILVLPKITERKGTAVYVWCETGGYPVDADIGQEHLCRH